MEKVKIVRRKRDNKKTSAKNKVLAGIGVGSALMGGIGAVSPKPPTTQFVRSQETQANESPAGKIKGALKKIFGVTKAEAATGYSYSVKNNGGGSYTITLNDPAGTSITAGSRNELSSKIQKYNNNDAEDAKKFGALVQAVNSWSSFATETEPAVVSRTVGSSVGRGSPTSSSATSATIENKTSGNTGTFAVGESWQITVKGAPNTEVYVIGGKNGEQIKNTMGKTDSNGTFTLSGTTKSSEIGSWQESWYVGDKSAGQINFEVVASKESEKAPAASSETVVLNAGQYNFTYFKNPTITLPNGYVTPQNPQFFPTLETAQKVAQLLGGEVRFSGGSGYSHPQYLISFPQAPKLHLSAGLLAKNIERNGVEAAKKSVSVELKGMENEYSIGALSGDEGVSSGSLQGDIALMQSNAETYYSYGQEKPGSYVAPGYSQIPSSTAETFRGGGTSTNLFLGQSLGNSASSNEMVYISQMVAVNTQGKTVGMMVKPGDIIEIGGTGLDVYSEFHIVAGGQEIKVTNAVVSHNKIQLTIPALGSLADGTNIQVRLISGQSGVRQGMPQQYFVYQTSATSDQGSQGAVIDYGSTNSAGVQQEIAALRQEVAQLRSQVDELTKLLESINSK